MDTRAIESALAQLHYDWSNFSVDDFAAHVAHLRQRELHLQGIPLTTRHFSGMCVIMTTTDYIFYDTNRHSTVQQHTVLHEMAHLILNHTSALVTLPNAQELMALIQRLMLRSAYTTLPLADQKEEIQLSVLRFWRSSPLPRRSGCRQLPPAN